MLSSDTVLGEGSLSGILWIAYRAYDGSSNDRIVVDKSCDGGKTWSGAVLVNAPEPPTTNMRFPAFAFTPDAAPHIVATASDHLAYVSLAPCPAGLNPTIHGRTTGAGRRSTSSARRNLPASHAGRAGLEARGPRANVPRADPCRRLNLSA